MIRKLATKPLLSSVEERELIILLIIGPLTEAVPYNKCE